MHSMEGSQGRGCIGERREKILDLPDIQVVDSRIKKLEARICCRKDQQMDDVDVYTLMHLQQIGGE